MRQRNAFTLIELLVVVAIIALLVAILLPSLSAARAEGERVVCMSNCKQWAYAFWHYCNDNDGDFPDLEGPPVHPPWHETFEIYLTKGEGIWDCPSNEYRDEWGALGYGVYGYAMPFANVLAYPARLKDHHPIYAWPISRVPHKLQHVPSPSELMCFAETSIPGAAVLTPYGPNGHSTWPLDHDYDGDGVMDSNSTEYFWYSETWGFPVPYNRLAPRHAGTTGNIGFMDSHVESQEINDTLYNRKLWAVELVGMTP